MDPCFCRKFYSIEVLASEDGSASSLTGTATVNIEILDVNDNTPQFDSPAYQFEIFENRPVGTAVGNVSATDRDEGTNAQVQKLTHCISRIIESTGVKQHKIQEHTAHSTVLEIK